MFLHLSVRHSVHWGLPQCMLGYTPGTRGRHPPNGTLSNDETVSVQTEHITATDGTTVETVETGKTDTENSSAALLPEAEHANERTLLADTTIEKVIGEISYCEHSDELQQDMTLGDIPPNLSSMQPIKTLSVVSELPEFSQTPDTTLTNSSSGCHPLSKVLQMILAIKNCLIQILLEMVTPTKINVTA